MIWLRVKKLPLVTQCPALRMCVGCCTSEHSLEHALSAYHQELPHGAGLIMISKAYYEHFIKLHVCDERFIKMAQVMGMKEANKPEDFITMLVKLQQDCGVAELKCRTMELNQKSLRKWRKMPKAAWAFCLTLTVLI